ncbi:MAG TPA: SMR family transporter [Pusillimonas sp.]|uniref:SMR family transporter n=1 Tax=Pusillimonas sp. TaxID=3040095 RepID=UPI002B956674|nr:SMR family transporter [Pusillimonas sp.]HUH87816.1 SMR family transporter [Pusillimonas sp.]
MKSIITAYGALGMAIVLEVIGTTMLQKSAQFTKFAPTLTMAACYLSAFYFLSIVLKTMPVGLAYAIWSGLGVVLISLVGYLLFGQKLDLPALIGLGFIILGVLIVNLFSKTIHH